MTSFLLQCVVDKAKLVLEIIWLASNCLEILYTKSSTEKPILPTSGIWVVLTEGVITFKSAQKKII